MPAKAPPGSDVVFSELIRCINRGLDDAASATRKLADELMMAVNYDEQPKMINTSRYVGEVVELTRDCELGHVGERAVVLKLEAPHYMTLVFYGRSPGCRTERTGADYSFLREVQS